MIPIRDENKPSKPPITNLILIFICGVVFWQELSLFGQSEGAIKAFVERWGIVPARDVWGFIGGFSLEKGFPFTYLSHQFVHGGWLHFIFNMWGLWIFGDNVEDKMGRVGYLLYYLLCGILAGFTQVYLNPDSTVPMVGASGAIAGVMAAYMFIFPKHKVVTFVPVFFLPLFFRVPALTFIGIWFVFQIFSAFYITESGVAFGAHIGGFVAGAMLHRLWLFGRKNNSHQINV